MLRVGAAGIGSVQIGGGTVPDITLCWDVIEAGVCGTDPLDFLFARRVCGAAAAAPACPW